MSVFTFKSEKQADFFAEVLERNGLTEAQAAEKWPRKQGFQILDLLLDQERQANLKRMSGDAPSSAQRRLVTRYAAFARSSGKSDLADRAEALLEDWDASKARFSRALDILKERLGDLPMDSQDLDAPSEEEPF